MTIAIWISDDREKVRFDLPIDGLSTEDALVLAHRLIEIFESARERAPNLVRHRWTAAEKEDVRRRYLSGEANRTIAASYGVTANALSPIITVGGIANRNPSAQARMRARHHNGAADRDASAKAHGEG